MTIANVEMAAAWDGDEGSHWAAHAERYESTSRRYRERLLATAAVAIDSVVLDVGCGTGRSTRDAARAAKSGSALGIDLSSRMLERARESAEAGKLKNCRFESGDVQVHPLPQNAFDLAISSFGAMFFSDPVAAFTNVAKALRDDGRIVLLAWRELSRNEWVRAIRDALAVGRALPDPPDDAPGPFGLARQEHAEDVLTRAGFVDVRLEDVSEPIYFGRNADEAFAFVSTFGITRGLTHDLDEARSTAALDALRRTLAEHQTGEGVEFAGSAWLITGRGLRERV